MGGTFDEMKTPPVPQNTQINSAIIGYGLATVSFFIFVLTAFLFWSAYAESLQNGFSDNAQTLLVEAAVMCSCIVLGSVGIKITTPVSDRFLGMVYMPLGLIMLIASIYYLFVDPWFHPQHHPGVPQYDVLSVGVALYLMTLGLGKFLNKDRRASGTGPLAAPTSGSLMRSIVDFVEMFVLAITITVGSIAAIVYGLMYLLR